MRRRSRLAVGAILLALATLTAPAPAAADTEGSIVVSVDIAPRGQATAADLARAGVDPVPGLLVAAMLGLSGAAAVLVARRRGVAREQ